VIDSAPIARSAVEKRILQGATLALGLLAAAYLAEGFFRSLWGPIPQDLARRWLEGAYLVRHINSMDVYAGVHAAERDLGAAHPGGYPPWATAFGLFIAPPIRSDWSRAYFAALNAAGLWFMARYAASESQRYGRTATCFLVASCLAVSAHGVVLRNGQYGIVINAALICMAAALVNGRPGRGGAWLALAATKPQTSAPFALLWLARRSGIVALAVAAALCGAATAAVAIWLHASPFYLVAQVFGQAANWDGGDAGPLRLLLTLGVPRGRAIPALAAVFVSGGALLLHRFRRAPVSLQLAIACVSGRLWTYHRRYDDVMLVFLLVPLGLRALERRRPLDWLAFTLVGLTLWPPFRESDHGPWLIALKSSIWLGALTWLLHGFREGPLTRSTDAA